MTDDRTAQHGTTSTAACIMVHANAATGAYSLEVRAAPEGLATAGDLPGLSADLAFIDGPASLDEMTLVCSLAVPSPYGLEPLTWAQCVVGVFLYQATVEADILALAVRIMPDYAAFYTTRGIFYTGVFWVTGALGPCLGELVVYQAATQEEAARLGREPLPEAITAIDQEYHGLMDRARPRYLLWLVPRGQAAVPITRAC